MHPFLNTAIKAARRAGQLVLRYSNQLERIAIESKGRNDFVTEVDRQVEQEIISILQGAYPDHGILAEESGRHQGNEFEWIIDPLDGTTNYLHSYPQFSISIALRHKDKLTQAVVFDPMRDELFTASRGEGAQLNDRRIRVSKNSRLEHSLLGTGFPFKNLDKLEIWIDTFRHLIKMTQGIRRAGSAALDLAYVASGRLDGFWELGLHPWDMAAGCLLIEEAGGFVCDFSGGQDFLRTGNVVTANSAIHAPLLDIVQSCLPPDFT